MILNEKQEITANTHKGAIIIVAGAGSGKTRTITERTRRIISAGKDPKRILCITFTNKAADEMKDRIGNKYVNIMTFHKLGLWILRTEYAKYGIMKDFTIVKSPKKILKKILYKSEIDGEKISKLLWEISKYKNCVFDSNYEKISHIANFGKIFQELSRQMFLEKTLDLDDLIYRSTELFANSSKSREYWQNRFDYIMIDEFQDTNSTQYTLVKYLAEKHKNICVVGDDAQSIYGWRFAQPSILQAFSTDFDATVIKLEQNYRSTKEILNYANKIIDNASGIIKKKLWTNKEIGEEPIFNIYERNDAEAVDVISQIVSNKNIKETAVLYRANFQSQDLENVCMRYNIPYKIIGNVNFFERQEIKDILSYIKLCVNPNSITELERVAMRPRKGIGTKTINKIRKRLAKENIFDILDNIGNQRKLIKDFTETLKNYHNLIDSKDVAEMVSQIIREFKYYDYLDTLENEERTSRLENIQQLIVIAYDYSEDKGGSLKEFLDYISLQTKSDEKIDKDKISLLTIHAAKGMEFDNVYLISVEEGILPHIKSVTPEQIEEERRLFYVAATRARKMLHISFNKNRQQWRRRTTPCYPSRFLFEIQNQGEEE